MRRRLLPDRAGVLTNSLKDIPGRGSPKCAVLLGEGLAATSANVIKCLLIKGQRKDAPVHRIQEQMKGCNLASKPCLVLFDSSFKGELFKARHHRIAK